MNRRGKSLGAGRAVALAVLVAVGMGAGEAAAQAGQAVPSASQLYVRKAGDTMSGALRFLTPFGTNRPAVWLRHTTGTSMGIGVATSGYDLLLGEATASNASITPRLVVTTAGSYPVVVGGGWASATLYDMKAKSITVAGAATGSLSCSAAYGGNLAHDTTQVRLTYCDGVSRTVVARRDERASFHVAYLFTVKTATTRQAQAKTDMVFTTGATGRLSCTAQTLGVGAGDMVVHWLKDGVSQGSYTTSCASAVDTDSGASLAGFTGIAGTNWGIKVDGSGCTTAAELMCNLELRNP